MDSERQPLLLTRRADKRYMTYDEVIAIRKDPKWRRAHILMLLTFWTIIAAAVSLIVAWLVTAPACKTPVPVVPPVHLTLAPLASMQGL